MFTSLPLVAEDQFASFVSGQFNGAYQKMTPTGVVTGFYSVTRGFTVATFEAPLVMVKAGRFKEMEPQTNVWEGSLSVGIITQIDDDASNDCIQTHDSMVTQIYGLMQNPPLVMSGVNAENFQLFGYYFTNYDHDLAHGELKRELLTVLEFSINCQTLGLV